MALFKNREDAARELAKDLAFLRNDQPLVLGIPNYGVPIAAVIAGELNASLDILLIAKLKRSHTGRYLKPLLAPSFAQPAAAAS